MTVEELTQRVLDLTEKMAKLETLIEQHQKTFESIDRRFERLETSIEELRRDVDRKLDRFFWLWVTTVAAGSSKGSWTSMRWLDEDSRP
ncbi:MAG: hypothetical protein QXS72_09305 [Candidatus Caldarchaeum sp.]